MFKRVGVFAFVLTTGALFLQPAAAFAGDRDHDSGRYTVEYRDNARAVQQEFREPIRRDDRDSDRVAHVRDGWNDGHFRQDYSRMRVSRDRR